MTTTAQKGFTLVELAIVITIIGLLIGGILKGQELLVNARVVATVTQVRSVEASATTFYDSYGGQPGDINGVSMIPGCTAACDLTPAGSMRDGVIGDPDWPMTTPQITSGLPLSATIASETMLFWYYLGATGMISAVDGTNLLGPSDTPVFGKNLPATKFGGGMIVGHSDGAQLGSRGTGSANVTITGNVVAFVVSPTAANDIMTPGAMLLAPSVAARIDRKMDDGLPGTGSVQAFGNAACVNAGSMYFESNIGKHCGLYIHIQG